MKIKIFLSGLLIVLISISAYQKQNTPSDAIQADFNLRLDSFKLAIKSLSSLASQDRNVPGLSENIRIQYQNVRKHYKEWEYIADWLDPVFIKDQLNGVPLPKLEQNTFGLNVIQPLGIQVVDELIYDDSMLVHLDDLNTQLKKIDVSLDQYQNFKIHDADVFIAARMTLIRMFAMGSTGFDVPGSLSALDDLKNIASVLNSDISKYRTSLESKDKMLSDSMFDLLSKQVSYLSRQKDFNGFDRFEYLKSYINPLFSMLLRAHVKLEFELPSEIKVRKMAVNYMATDIFSADLLDVAYYLDMPSKFRNSKTVELGKLLFFDPILSANNQRACASCHKPELAFSDGKEKSEAFDHQGHIKRNSPSLWNCVFSGRYFHDLRAKDFTDQIEHVVVSSSEFNTDWKQIVEKLNGSKAYQDLFAEAFDIEGDRSINVIYIRYAIAAFVAELRGFNSEFDRMIHDRSLKPDKRQKTIIDGFNLFMGKAACGTCHFVPVFNGTVPPWYSDSESEVLGVPEKALKKGAKIDSDLGRGGAMLKEQIDFYKHSFKTPSLRNIAKSAPYMHNGVYKDLESLMDFYNRGGGAGIGIHLEYQTLSTDALNLSKKEISSIIRFMESLSDEKFEVEIPKSLPSFENHPELDSRVIGGIY